MEVPKYLNENFLKKVIWNGFGVDDAEILSKKVEIATCPGDNYNSTIHRIFLTFTDGLKKRGDPKKIQFLVKHLNGFETGETFAEFGGIYDLEKDMLKDIMPQLSRLTEGIQFAPRHYHSLPGRQLMLIAMEDLKELNYRMVERRIGLDYEHCCIVLRKLGQMHAASMSLVKGDPSLLDKYTFAPLPGSEEKPGLLQTYFSVNFPTLCKISKNWEDFEDISLKLDRMKDNFWDLVPKSLSRRNDGYKVLSHGDIWINNILFKYNVTTGKPTDVLFVDFQGSLFTSPAYDLQYFFNSSPQNWVRDHQRDDLLHIYYNAFAATLKNMEYEKIPTFADLEEEMLKKELYGFLTAVFTLPLACVEEQSAQRSGHVGLSDEEARKELALIMFSGKRYCEAIKSILKRLDRIGFFDDYKLIK